MPINHTEKQHKNGLKPEIKDLFLIYSKDVGPSGRAVQRVGLRPLAC